MKKQKSSYLVTILYYVIDTVYTYSWENIGNILSLLVMLYVNNRFFIIARGVQLENEVNPPGTQVPCIFLQDLSLTNINHI